MRNLLSPSSVHGSALRTAAGYAVFGLLWILFSDRLLLSLTRDVAVLSAAGVYKGFAFVLATSALLYLVVRRAASRQLPAPLPAIDDAGAQHPHMLAWVLAAVAAVVLLAGMVGVTRSAREVHAQAAARLHTVADLKARVVSQWIEARRHDMQQLHRDRDLQRYLEQWRTQADEASRERLAGHLRAILFAAQYTSVRLLDANGDTLLVEGEAAAAPEPAARRSAQQALASGEVRDTGLFLSSADSTLSFEMAVPMAAGRGQPPLVLVLRADPQRELQPRVHNWSGAGAGAGVLLLRRDGSDLVLFGDTAQPTRVPADDAALAVAQVFRQGAAAPGVALRGLGDSGESVESLAVPVQVPGSDWFVATHVPAKPIDAQIWQDAVWIALVNGLALLAAGIVVHSVLQRRELRSARLQQAQQDERLRALNLLDAIANGSSDAISRRTCKAATSSSTGKPAGSPADRPKRSSGTTTSCCSRPRRRPSCSSTTALPHTPGAPSPKRPCCRPPPANGCCWTPRVRCARPTAASSACSASAATSPSANVRKSCTGSGRWPSSTRATAC
jgi:heme exporter protein D